MHPTPEQTITQLLRHQSRQHPDHVVCRWGDERITYGELDRRVDHMACELRQAGLGPGDRVPLMLPQHPDHIVVFLGLLRLGAIVVPVNTQLRGDSLRYILQHSEPSAIIADARHAEALVPQLDPQWHVFWRLSDGGPKPAGGSELPCIHRDPGESAGAWPDPADPEATVAICYTSGTTGPPKGVLVSDRMGRCAAESSAVLSGMQDGDVALFWDPLYHLFGIEVLILALSRRITLAMVERFSASNFWTWAKAAGATHMHYVGGVIQLLLKQPSSPQDREHSVRIAWGGGCPVEAWQAFEERFGLRVHDSFGMTETAALNLVNTEGAVGSVGKPLPSFQARLVNEAGEECASGELGELLIRGNRPGVITRGYYNNPEATAALFRSGWLRTGDLLRREADGNFYFHSRKKDSVRRRGENISAWEVERVVNRHPKIVDSALLAVRNEFDDEDLKIVLQVVPGETLCPDEFIAWCRERMPKFHVPRFVSFIDSFPRTPTHRIQKFVLDRTMEGCWDAQREHYEESHNDAR